jgi:hypothetical protein
MTPFIMQEVTEKPDSKRGARRPRVRQPDELPEEVRDRLSGLLPEEALQDALKGLDPSPTTSTTAAGHGSAPPANADYDTPAGRASHTIESSKLKPTAGAPPMWTNSLPDLWL